MSGGRSGAESGEGSTALGRPAASWRSALPHGSHATAEEVETAILQRMTVSRKLAVMQGLWQQAWALKQAGVRRQHPDWTAAQGTARVRELFGGAGS